LLIAYTGTFWTAEYSVSFEALAEHTTRNTSTPGDQEAWFFIFARYKMVILIKIPVYYPIYANIYCTHLFRACILPPSTKTPVTTLLVLMN